MHASDAVMRGSENVGTYSTGLPLCTVAHCAEAAHVLLVASHASEPMTTLLPSHHHYLVSLVLYYFYVGVFVVLWNA